MAESLEESPKKHVAAAPKLLVLHYKVTILTFTSISLHLFFGKQLFWECRFAQVEENMWRFVEPQRHLLVVYDSVAFSDRA